jgi:hypothetical protein
MTLRQKLHASPDGPGVSRQETSGGFALLMVLVVLGALYVGATGLFLAARAELWIGISHVASSQAFYLTEAGLATWLAGPVQPARADYTIGGHMVAVHATPLLRVDSIQVLYRIEAWTAVGSGRPGDPAAARRGASLLGVRVRDEFVRAVPGSWREVL